LGESKSFYSIVTSSVKSSKPKNFNEYISEYVTIFRSPKTYNCI
jgi:hypothetical protein